MLERRRALGQDIYDEVWNGEYHVIPAPHPSHGRIDRQLARLLDEPTRAAGLVDTGIFNLGDQSDYRVPDGGLHRGDPRTTFVPTAAVVIEIVSPDDETWNKLDFYAAHDVDELLIVDPQDKSVRWFALEAGQYREVEGSRLLGVAAASLGEQLDWPPVG